MKNEYKYLIIKKKAMNLFQILGAKMKIIVKELH